VKIFDAYKDRDFGIDAYLTIGQFENLNIIDAEFHSSFDVVRGIITQNGSLIVVKLIVLVN